MLLDSRLEKRTLGGQVTEDYQDTQDDSAIYTTIKTALIGIAGYKLYRSGALKEVSGAIMEYADKLAKSGNMAASIMGTVKQWTKLKDLSARELANSKTQKWAIPKDPSIFRPRESSIFYDIYEDLTNLDLSSNFTSTKNFQNLRKLMNGTQTDLHLLKEMIEENNKNLPNKRTDYTNTQLYKHIQEIANMDRNMRYMSEDITQAEARSFNVEAMDFLVRKHTLTREKAAQQIKESGYRELTLGDVAFMENGMLKARKNVAIDLDSKTNPKYESLIERLNTVNSTMHTSRGSLLNDWKNLIIDTDIRINESGNIIDFRMSKDNFNEFRKSLATDFRLPLVQFNPLKSLLGFDKKTRIEPMVGYLSPNQFNAGITKIAGQEFTIGEFLSKEFGSEFANKPIAVIDGNLFISKPRANGNGNELIKIGEGFRLHNITYADESMGLKPLHNAYRQMSGITTTPGQEKSTFIGSDREFINEIYKKLDIGFEEWTPENEDLFESMDSRVSVDEFQNKIIERLRDLYKHENVKINDIDFKSMFGNGYGNFIYNNRDIQPYMYDVTKKGFTLTDILDDLNKQDYSKAKKDLYSFGRQYLAGQRSDGTMSDYFTERSGVLWTAFNQISEGLKTAGLGLSVDSKRSPLNLGWNLLVKRALPLYMLTQVPGMINYFSEPFFSQDEDGNRDNISKVLMRGVVKPIDITAHKAMDLFGITKLFKFMGEMTPGSDQINELPGIYQLGLGQTAEEREDYIENGYDPIRKSRWWGAGNTPFTGGKIEYWRPNKYRRVQADVEFSDSKYGSRQEYYNNTWYPNLVNPLAPINHFILDRNHYDKKHYYDRPYLMTSPEGTNMPLFGPLFSQTIGRVINPPQKMHKEYWNKGFQVNPLDEEPSTLLTEGKLYTAPFDNHINDINVYNQVNQQLATANAVYQQGLSESAYQAKQVVSKSYIENAGITFQQRSILPVRTYDRYNTPYEVYSTPSGALNVVDVPDEMNLYNVNEDLKRWSLNKVLGTEQRIEINDINGPGIPVGNDNKAIDNAFVYGIGEQYNWLGEIAGLKGFALQQFVTGHPNENARILEDSGYAYSFSNNFWEENLGGLGANLSEITRRFIPKRNNDVEYINPIRNTMPSWMPGSSYFTDFKHGDPYSKIPNGEERLPGEGYERLHGIKNLMDFNIGSSSIGYDKSYIVKHMLRADPYTSAFEEDTLDTGNEFHRQIEKAWKDAGIAFSTEGEIKDTRNGIIGYYDAMIHDPTSRTGVGIVDIKTTSAKKLDEIRKSGKPLDHHQRQVNYYLWATQNEKSRGYIYYVDKENPTNTYTVGFDYSESLLKDTLNNVYEARKEIRDAVDKGIIGRGELYKPIDQFRILADVAPYSQEYKDASARLSFENLTPEEQEEASQIRERVTKQKEPLRVYDYKFKTSNLKTETVTVQKVIDNNTIVTKEYGKKHSIKFAGINVSMSNSEMYDENRTKNDAAADEIRKYIRPGRRITISYDADERNKYSKDSTKSIRAVVKSHGVNVNQRLLNKGMATEKEEDNSPAAIHARYTKGEIAFGSAMETITHDIVSKIPFVGSKMLQVRSPYESYRQREVYGKDFQSWNNPIRDILIPHIETNIADSSLSGFGGIIAGAFMGSLFGAKNNQFGKIVGAVIGGTIPAIGKIIFAAGTDKERDWRPKRRRDQEELNEYVDVLKYVKNTRLYEQYKLKAKKEDNFDVEAFMKSKEYNGVENKLRQTELTDYKRKVKLDFKHRDNYNFKYGKPKYVESGMTKKETISAINKEISEIQGQRKITKVPVNALKAIEFKQAADNTMYGYNPGDSLVNIMTALPKKDRQYFKHFMDAPEEEKEKILRIAPSYMRRALQSTWGKTVDKKPTLNEYFMSHGLPDASWIGWDENTNINDVKVKLVHQNKLDPGEFDIWEDNERQADEVNIPIPQMNARNSARQTQMKLQQLLGRSGYNDVQVMYMNGHFGNSATVNIQKDSRDDVASQIALLEA